MDSIEDIVIATWITGLHRNKDFSYDDLLIALGKLDLAPLDLIFAQENCQYILDEYYELDRRDAELEAKYYPHNY